MPNYQGVWSLSEQYQNASGWPVFVPPIVTDGLVLHLDAGNSNSYSGSGSTWTDLSGNGHNATLYNTTFSSANSGSLVFNGTSSQGVTTLQRDNADFSYFAVVNAPAQAANGDNDILDTFESTSQEWTRLSVKGSSTPVTPSTSIDNDGTKRTVDGSTNIINTWVMLTVTRSGSSMKLYVNDGLDNSRNDLTTTIVEGLEPLYIGSSTNDNEWFTGNIAVIGTYSKELSSSEISQNFESIRGRFGI
jgi:hypothetical protein